MRFWILHIRKIIWGFSIILALADYLYIKSSLKSLDLQNIRLAETFALTAIIYLYITLLNSPLYSVFPNFPFRPIYNKASRALGTCAFFFALLHATVAFFFLLGGFSGLKFLDNTYLLAISFSFTALIILAAMAATSFDYMVAKLGRRWKQLHRFVYAAAVLVALHAFLLGSHFSDVYGLVPQIFYIAAIILLLLESTRLAKYLTKKYPKFSTFAYNILIFGLFIIIGLGLYRLVFPGGPAHHH